jgi:excisionase family DNA binding protein
LLMRLLSTREVADRLGVSILRVQQLIWAERLPAQKVGRDYVINESDLKLVENRKPGRPSKQVEARIKSSKRSKSKGSSKD